MNYITYKVKKGLTLIKRLFIKNIGFIKESNLNVSLYAGSSFPFGKIETINFIDKIFENKCIKILDVGPGQGIYGKMLRAKGYRFIEAVEIYMPYIKQFNLKNIYQKVFNEDIVSFEYEKYDLIIMGDIIEHLDIRKAQKVIDYAKERCDLIIVAVPYKLKQIGFQLDGSGDHRQYDLTREVFLKRYPGFNLFLDNEKAGIFYAY